MKMSMSRWLITCALAANGVLAGTQIIQMNFATSDPIFKAGTQTFVGLLGAAYDRDSCVSTRVASRQFWVCRDSQAWGSEQVMESTAGWSTFNADGTPLIENGNLTVTGTNTHAYFMPAENECASGDGYCSDGGRWPIWPDSPPLPVNLPDGSVKMYNWIRQVHFPDASKLYADSGPFPPISLYRLDWNPSMPDTALPTSTLVEENFFPNMSVPFGEYGWVEGIDGYAYLYGQAVAGTMVARVALGQIENINSYQYYDGSSWTSTRPSVYDINGIIAHAGTGGQGTFFYSDKFNMYIWMGQPFGASTALVMSTSKSPEGPWSVPTTLFDFPVESSYGLQYSFQAIPGLSQDQGDGNDIYISETVQDGAAGYLNKLYLIQWQN